MADLSEHHADLSDTVRTLMNRAQNEAQADTISGLARALDQQQPNLSGKIRGRRGWSLDDLFDVAAHYGVDPADVVRMMAQAREHRGRLDALTTGTD